MGDGAVVSKSRHSKEPVDILLSMLPHIALYVFVKKVLSIGLHL